MKIFLYKFQLHIALYSAPTQFSSISKMDLTVYIQLIFLCVVNIIFTFSGIVLNTLVIASFWKSSQLRKKLCHFMIMVLSCFDLVAVITNYPGILLYLIIWLREDYDLLPKINASLDFLNVFLAFSFCSLIVMSIERYLGAYYPIFHRTTVTRRRLLTLLAVSLILTTVMYVISNNDLVISGTVSLTILLVIFLPSFIFVNFKLLIIVKKVDSGRAVLSGKRTRKKFKNISTGLWVVACLILLYIPSCLLIALHFAQKSKDIIRLCHVWGFTCATMNCTLNSLIFFWNNKVLRAEGIKILKTLKYEISSCWILSKNLC